MKRQMKYDIDINMTYSATYAFAMDEQLETIIHL